MVKGRVEVWNGSGRVEDLGLLRGELSIGDGQGES